MNKKNDMKNRIALFSVLLLSVIAVLVGVTYAYFAGSLGEVKNQTVTVKTGTLMLTFSDTSDTPTNIQKTMYFGDTVEKELKIENTGTKGAYAKISWEYLVNTYLPESLTYTLEQRLSTSDVWERVYTPKKNVPTSTNPSTQELADRLYIPGNSTYIYRLTITLENLLSVDQTQDLEANFVTKFTLEHGTVPPINELNLNSSLSELLDMSDDDIKNIEERIDFNSLGDPNNPNWDYINGLDKHARMYILITLQVDVGLDISEHIDKLVHDEDKLFGILQGVKRIVFEPTISTKEQAVYTYDISTRKENGVVGQFVPTEEDNTKYTLYIQANGKIIGTPNSVGLFGILTNLESIEGLENFDTSQVSNMSFMFNGCSSLTTLDLSNFDTSNVTQMESMFDGCSNLTTLDVSNFDTSNVTNMMSMFNSCSSLTTLDVSGFNTSNVTDMSFMFNSCSGLTTLDVSKFNTSKVTTMTSMFYGCNSLTTLDLSNFNTSNVSDMSFMFYDCSSLTTLDVSNFDTSKVTYMQNLFYKCRGLTTLDLSNFDTSKVINMGWMFQNCSGLTTLNVSNFDTSKVTNMQCMFFGCSGLTTLNLSKFDTSKVTDVIAMFKDCNNLTALNLSNWSVSSITDKIHLFLRVPSSIQVTVSNNDIKQWMIDASDSPKFTDSNFVLVNA